MLACDLLLPLAGLAVALRRGRQAPAPLTLPGASAYLILFTALSYAVWLYMFRIQRYLTPLEMLAPLLLVTALGALPGPRTWRGTAAAVVVAMVVFSTQPADWGRVAWSARAVEVELPRIAEPERTLVLMAGHDLYSYLLPAFPPQLRFLRIDSNFTNIHGRQVAFKPLMQRIVAAHQGPLAVLYVAEEDGDVRRKLTEYGLAMDAAACQPVRANLALDGPNLYCPVFRQGRPVYPLSSQEISP